MEHVIATWLAENLPVETYPYVHWASGHFDVARPTFILLAGLYVAFTIFAILFVRALLIAVLDRFGK